MEVNLSGSSRQTCSRVRTSLMGCLSWCCGRKRRSNHAHYAIPNDNAHSPANRSVEKGAPQAASAKHQPLSNGALTSQNLNALNGSARVDVSSMGRRGSLTSDCEEFHSARDDFSTAGSMMDGFDGGSPPQSFSQGVHGKHDPAKEPAQAYQSSHYSSGDQQHHQHQLRMPVSPSGGHARTMQGPYMDSRTEPFVNGASESSEEPTAATSTLKVGCLSILDSISKNFANSSNTTEHYDSHMHNGKAYAPRRMSQLTVGGKPDAGVSLQRRDYSISARDACECWEDVDGCTTNVRSIDYMKDKKKVLSESSIYRLVATDMFTFDHKQNHIAQLVNLPPVPPRQASNHALPPLLIINLQLPNYSPSLFGGKNDGPGWSIVYYFALPEDFDPATFPNQKALGLLQRFVQNGREADGTSTRDRLKIIPKVVNVKEWAERAPLSTAENKLLVNYNEKPILARPQHAYFAGPGYLEVDLDIHSYTYLARQALTSFMSRLSSVVWENAFVVQGNSPDELPEQVFAAARIYRTNFLATRPYTDYVPEDAAASVASGDTADGHKKHHKHHKHHRGGLHRHH